MASHPDKVQQNGLRPSGAQGAVVAHERKWFQGDHTGSDSTTSRINVSEEKSR